MATLTVKTETQIRAGDVLVQVVHWDNDTVDIWRHDGEAPGRLHRA